MAANWRSTPQTSTGSSFHPCARPSAPAWAQRTRVEPLNWPWLLTLCSDRYGSRLAGIFQTILQPVLRVHAAESPSHSFSHARLVGQSCAGGRGSLLADRASRAAQASRATTPPSNRRCQCQLLFALQIDQSTKVQAGLLVWLGETSLFEAIIFRCYSTSSIQTSKRP